MAVGKVDKWKLKKWYNVTAPKHFKEVTIGEIPANSDSAVSNRNLIVDLFSITNNPAHMYTNVKLKIYEASGESARTRLICVEQLYSYIRSLTRRHKTISELVAPLTTKDNVKMVVKLIAVANGRIATSKKDGIRVEAIGMLKSYFEQNNSDQIVDSVIEKKLQGEISSKLSHITNISKVEIKKLEIPLGI